MKKVNLKNKPIKRKEKVQFWFILIADSGSFGGLILIQAVHSFLTVTPQLSKNSKAYISKGAKSANFGMSSLSPFSFSGLIAFIKWVNLS